MAGWQAVSKVRHRYFVLHTVDAGLRESTEPHTHSAPGPTAVNCLGTAKYSRIKNGMRQKILIIVHVAGQISGTAINNNDTTFILS